MAPRFRQLSSPSILLLGDFITDESHPNDLKQMERQTDFRPIGNKLRSFSSHQHHDEPAKHLTVRDKEEKEKMKNTQIGKTTRKGVH
jgi:hypothetical protein